MRDFWNKLGIPLLFIGGGLVFYAWLWSRIAAGHPALSELGQMGDSFGVITSLFGILAFWLSWRTNEMQREELKEQGEELKKQREFAERQLQITEEQLRAAQEQAYAQRLNSLRAEAESYGKFVWSRGQALEHLRQLERAFGGTMGAHSQQSALKRLHELAEPFVVLPFEDPTVDRVAQACGSSIDSARASYEEALQNSGGSVDIRPSVDRAREDGERAAASLLTLERRFRDYYAEEVRRHKTSRPNREPGPFEEDLEDSNV